MKTIEDKLQAAHELGRIVGAAECFADEDVRNTVCGAAHALFDGLLTEAAEEAEASRETTASLIRLDQNYPPDPFDFVETEEMVEKEPEPKKQTNFDRITTDVKSLAMYLTDLPECDRGKTCPFNGGKELPTQDDCFGCTVQWLYEEVGK